MYSYLHLVWVTLNNDIVEASADATVTQLLALFRHAARVLSYLMNAHKTRERLRELQKTGTLTKGWPFPSAIVFPAARPWFPATYATIECPCQLPHSKPVVAHVPMLDSPQFSSSWLRVHRDVTWQSATREYPLCGCRSCPHQWHTRRPGP